MRTLGVLLLAAMLGLLAWHDEADRESKDKALDRGTSRFLDTADQVQIIKVDRSSGPVDRATVVVVIKPGYHINANPASMDNLIPTTLTITTPAPLRVLYPKPVHFKPDFGNDVLDVYEGTINIIAEFAPGNWARHGRLSGTLTAQACTDQICLPPADLELPEQ